MPTSPALPLPVVYSCILTVHHVRVVALSRFLLPGCELDVEAFRAQERHPHRGGDTRCRLLLRLCACRSSPR
ncbi:hypothetical protein BD414DRAFT_578349, partial [Trametes punicea]